MKKVTKISSINTLIFLEGEGSINSKNEMSVEWNIVNRATGNKTKVSEVPEDYSYSEQNSPFSLKWHLRVLSQDFVRYCENNNLDLYSY